MKKSLLIIALCVLFGQTLMADNTVKIFTAYNSDYYGGEVETSGYFRGVSGNGKYAVGYDDGVCDYISFLWSAEKPNEMQFFKYSCYMSDVADDGTVVGAVLFKEGENEGAPGYYKDGEWRYLPMHETCYGADPITNTAIRISPDGKYIGGMLACEHAEGGRGRIYPCVWTRNDQTGEYDLTVYNNIDLPDNQGFILYDMSDDARYLVGRVFTGFGGTLPAYIKDGELYLFNELTEVTYTEEWDTNGDGEFTPDDPDSYDMYIETTDYYIDGILDRAQTDGQISSVDEEGNMVGWTTILTEDAGYSVGLFFNENKNDGKIVELMNMYGTAIHGEDCIFTSQGMTGPVLYLQSPTDEGVEIASYFAVEEGAYSTVQEVSNNGKVIVGSTIVMGEQNFNQPFLMMLENPCTEVQTIETENGKIEISVANREIVVKGAEEVSIYSLNGTLVSNKYVSVVEAGAYIVKADNKVTKVIVK